MKLHVECLPCLFRQALQVARLSRCTADQQLKVLQEAALLISGLETDLSPPAAAHPIYKKIADITGCEDPYLEKKRTSNEQALQLLPDLRKEIGGTVEEFRSAVRFAIAGNIIDYGAFESFDIEAAIEKGRTVPLAVDHLAAFEAAIASLRTGAAILYLTDNCGEIVYDALLIEYLYNRGFDLTVAVKDGPIINDALIDDARVAGLDKFARIITNGGRFPGTELEHCSSEFMDHFNGAELVISKGQGNFESLSQVDRDIFFLLTVKCPVAAEHMAEISGVDCELLQGGGEMAVYYSGIEK